ncbi:16259_t:CDS:2, partial [Gigaspora rosea]
AKNMENKADMKKLYEAKNTDYKKEIVKLAIKQKDEAELVGCSAKQFKLQLWTISKISYEKGEDPHRQ